MQISKVAKLYILSFIDEFKEVNCKPAANI